MKALNLYYDGKRSSQSVEAWFDEDLPGFGSIEGYGGDQGEAVADWLKKMDADIAVLQAAVAGVRLGTVPMRWVRRMGRAIQILGEDKVKQIEEETRNRRRRDYL